MRIEVFTFCWNEMAVLPFVVDYWKRFATRVTVFDNGSTDGSLEYMQQFPELITIAPFDTENQINDQLLLNYKNDCWRQARGRADLVVVCDMDEMVIPIGFEFCRMLSDGCTICRPHWFHLMSEENPQHEDGKLLHEIRPYAYPSNGKAIIFDPNKIENINYSPGAHECRPEGEVKWFDGAIYCLHADHNLSLEHKISRYRQMQARLSEMNRAHSWGIHYTFGEQRIRENWKLCWDRVVNLADILSQQQQPASKNPDAKIYICTHTDFDPVVSDDVYEVVDVRDGGENFDGVPGPFFSELLAIYRVSQRNHLPKYIGFCQYRKYLGFMNAVPDIEQMIRKYGCITTLPEDLGMTTYEQYGTWGNTADLDIATEIISEEFPDFAPAWFRQLNSHQMHLGTISIMPTSEWRWLLNVMWTVVQKYLERIDGDIDKRIKENPDAYHLSESSLEGQRRVGGQLAERIHSAWIGWRFDHPMMFPLQVTGDRKPSNPVSKPKATKSTNKKGKKI